MKRLVLALVVGSFPLFGAPPAFGASPDVVISQVYGGGGNSGAAYTHDYVELYNRGTETVSVDGWQLQYASASGAFGTASNLTTPLSGSIAPGRHLLVQEAQGAGGTTPLPSPDVTDPTPIAMSATSGKVRVLRADGTVADLVGYGAANAFEGSGPAPGLSNTTAAFRADGGARDTDDNAADFTAAPPNPRNGQQDPPPPPTGCDAPATHEIAAVQGAGASTPLANQTVRVEGIVTGDFQGSLRLNGFFVQDDTPDADPATSDGLFVFAPTAPDVAAGDRVLVSGRAVEFNGLTELANVAAVDLCGSGTITARPYDLPRDAGTTFEPVEGMLVTFPEALTATEHFQLGRFGEVTVASDGRLFQPTDRVAPGPAASELLDLSGRRRLLVDDGSTLQNPPAIPFAAPGAVVRIGDTASGVTGVLSFGFGLYRLQPTAPITFVRTNPRPPAPEPVGGDVRIASLNTLNYFTTLGSDNPNARGADTPEELERQRVKLVAAITALDADVVGLMELENNGTTAVQDLVDALNAATAPGAYAFVPEPVLNPPNELGGRFGPDVIKVGLIYRPARVAPVGAARTSADPIFDRPPLVQTFERVGGSEPFTVAVNHFKSKGCEGATGPDADQGDGQSCFNARRVEQATTLANLLDAHDVPNPLIVGDLNAYSEEDPIRALEAAGYAGLTELFVAEADRYSFVFDGFSGELDHAMAGEALVDNVTGASIWHVNADEPLILDYNTEFNPPELFEPNAYRSSDHDPLVVGLDLCDVTPPTLEVEASPTVLWPPNHRYRRVTTTVSAADETGADPTVTLVSVTSNEPDNAPGGADGNTVDDVVVVDDTTFDLRAERDETATGRVYTITYRATDACGNETTRSAAVTVPVRS